jgi:hypothetical protein
MRSSSVALIGAIVAAFVATSTIASADEKKTEKKVEIKKHEEPSKKVEIEKRDHEKSGTTTVTAADISGEGVIQDVRREVERPGPYRTWSVEMNPLSLFGGQLSFTGEYAVAPHHVIAVTPKFVRTSADIAAGDNTFRTETFSGGAVEAGYRYYTSRRGMEGLFVGPSLIFGVFNASLLNDQNQAFTNVGLAVDAGVQTILFDHLTLGAGAGLAYVNVSHNFGDLPLGPASVAATGFKPRLLATAGYAF